MEEILSLIDLRDKIITLRNQQVMLDADVANLYGVETKLVSKAVKNNPHKFPEGYVIRLDNHEKNEQVKNFHRLEKPLLAWNSINFLKFQLFSRILNRIFGKFVENY